MRGAAMEVTVYAALIVLLAHLIFGLILWFRVRKLYSFPGNVGFPVIGNLFLFYRTLFIISTDGIWRYFLPLADKYGKHGLFFHWAYGSKIAAIVTSPDVVKKLLFHPHIADKTYSMYGGCDVFMEGPFSRPCADDLWKLMKKEYNTFLKKSCVDNDYYDTFIKSTNKLVDMMLESPFAVGENVITMTLDVTMRTLIGIETSLVYHPEVIEKFDRLKDMGSLIMANGNMTRAFSPILQLLNDVILGKIVELRDLALKEINDSSFLNQFPLPEQKLFMLIASRYRKNNGSEKLLGFELQEMIGTAAHTTATTLANSIIFLAVLPDIQERGWQEQYEIFGNDTRDPTNDELKQMQFLDRFIKESLRFLGPTFISKKATADIIIDGVTIPRDTVVIYLMRYMKMDPNHWKNPNTFDPDRFLEENDSLKYTYTPFGIGVRSCPGVYFSTTLMKIALSKILRRLKLKTVEKDFQFEDIKYKNYLFMAIDNPPKLQVEKRR